MHSSAAMTKELDSHRACGRARSQKQVIAEGIFHSYAQPGGADPLSWCTGRLDDGAGPLFDRLDKQALLLAVVELHDVRVWAAGLSVSAPVYPGKTGLEEMLL